MSKYKYDYNYNKNKKKIKTQNHHNKNNKVEIWTEEQWREFAEDLGIPYDPEDGTLLGWGDD